MFTPTFRLLILVILSAAAVMLAMAGKNGWLLLASFLSLFILWDYFNRSTVPLALRKLAAGDYESAHKLLRHVKNPKRLNRANRAYYYFIKGMHLREKEDFEASKEALEEAQKLSIHNRNFKAMNILALADIAIIQKDKNTAKDYLKDIENLKAQPSIQESINRMQSYLKQNK